MSKMQNMSDEQIRKAIEIFNQKLPLIPEGEDRDLCLVGLDNFKNELARRNQKKTESQSVEKIKQLPTKQEMQEWAKKEDQQANYAHVETNEEQPTYTTTSTGSLKTIKAPVIDREPEYINIELTDQKGEKYIRTYNRAQTKALCRKYFSNVHNAWVGGNRKLTNGFDNLVAYFLGWVEFDGSTPGLQDVLQDYSRYRKDKENTEASEAFKIAQELYGKILSVITKSDAQ